MKRRTLIVVGVVAALLLVAAIALVTTLRYGFSAHDEPTAMERTVARTMRHWAAPSDLRGRKNPIPLTPDVLTEAGAHFADHCATCHGNDGKGQRGMGKKMYPKTPDMTLAATQQLSDGELFSIIENGVRLTGMPAWGKLFSDDQLWKVTTFLSHMDKLPPAVDQEWKNPAAPSPPPATDTKKKK